MSCPFQIEISESQEELEKALRHVTEASSKERLLSSLLAQEWSSEQQAIAPLNV
ncbi:hypothetical protein [uncultured Nostoc sp.]|uniref:hypothetical protein n=1 Tax=uncultured Nostoc sp. TaxID=340711 RepID=UPI0035C9E85F